MAISLASLKRSSERKPPRLLVYGTSGIGKTTLGTNAPAPVFIQTEDSEVGCPTFGLLKTYDEIMEAFATLVTDDHDFKTVVLDSLDWLEPIIWRETCRINKWASIEDPGYGKGYAAALDTWRVVLDGFNALRDERGMAVIWISHDLGVVAGLCQRVNVMYAGRVVESGPTTSIYRSPKHPYNHALQKSIPALQPKGAELYTIAGMPPDLSKPVTGCAFMPRCEFAQDVCRAPVELKTDGPGHATACTRAQRGEINL